MTVAGWITTSALGENAIERACEDDRRWFAAVTQAVHVACATASPASSHPNEIRRPRSDLWSWSFEIRPGLRVRAGASLRCDSAGEEAP